MKRAIVIAVALAVMIPAPDARAHLGSHDFVMDVALPCATLCANWDVPEAAGYSPCGNPFPAESYRDVLTEPAPDGGAGWTIMRVAIFPEVDWDLYVCSYPEYELLATGANLLAQYACKGLAGRKEVPIGCEEQADVLATPGERYVIRAYNWSDNAPLPGRYTWHFVPQSA
ncbi:MAG TPA: hypothetical protein VM600_05380 [Actinomycetota bacterium]|nr:hypothetical protein [Actinomycetota bacterium]